MKRGKRISQILLLCIPLILSGCTKEAQVDLTEVSRLQSELQTLQESMDVIQSKNDELESVLNEKTDMIKELESTKEEQSKKLEELEASLSAYPPIGPSASVIVTSQQVINALKTENFADLATYVHPTLGVRVTPYSYVDFSTDVVLTSGDVATMGTSPTTILWGAYDGSGDPIQLTPYNYYSEFIYDEDYDNADIIGHNTVIGSGNMINNLTSQYPTADFMEYHFTGFNPTYGGLDWTSLTLVYEQVGGLWYLVGMIHGQWTI